MQQEDHSDPRCSPMHNNFNINLKKMYNNKCPTYVCIMVHCNSKVYKKLFIYNGFNTKQKRVTNKNAAQKSKHTHKKCHFEGTLLIHVFI